MEINTMIFADFDDTNPMKFVEKKILLTIVYDCKQQTAVILKSSY